MPNAIERLRECVQYEADATDNLTPALDALAAVEALYQAAADVASYPLNLAPDKAYAALAAAVHRVEGEPPPEPRINKPPATERRGI